MTLMSIIKQNPLLFKVFSVCEWLFFVLAILFDQTTHTTQTQHTKIDIKYEE